MSADDYDSGYWSRRINDEHRLVYRATEDEVKILKARYHYRIRRQTPKDTGTPRHRYTGDGTSVQSQRSAQASRAHRSGLAVVLWKRLQ